MLKDTTKIWVEINDRLINFINQRVKNLELAKDISQDVFVIVHSNIESLQSEEKVIPWIYQITRNEINSHFRKLKRSQGIKPITDSEPQQVDYNTEFSQCISPMIDVLPEKYREAIKKSEIQGLSQKELARALDISYSGAKSRVQRGRVRLRKLLEECCEITTDSYGNITDILKKDCNL